MKAVFFVLVVAGLGIAAGIGIAMLRVGPSKPVLVVSKDLPSGPSAPSRENVPSPGLVIDAEDFDFGTVSEKAEGSHDFLFTNNGKAPLKLTLVASTSDSLTAKLEKEEIAPGESGKVTVSWKCGPSDQPFRQVVNVQTNAPMQKDVALTIFGQVNSAFSMMPEALVFRNISANEPSTATANLFCFRDQAINITEQVMANSAIAKHFEASFEPMAADALKAADPLAKSGVVVRVTVKPGLPPGPFVQQIVLKTNNESTPAFGIPVLGTVASDINIAGAGFDAQTDTLQVGVVSGKDGRQVRLMLLVRGPHRKEVAFKPAASTPSWLKVSLGQPTELNNGAIIQTPLLIDIPPGSPTANYLGGNSGQSAEIVLETTYPPEPKVKVLVRFAVEN